MKKLLFFLFSFSCLIYGQQITKYSLGSDGFITAWLIRGGYQVDEQRTREYDFLSNIGGENKLLTLPQFQDISDSKKAESSRWTAINTSLPIISFLDYISPSQSKVCYALTFIESDKEAPVTLKCGSDDGIIIFLNGELIHNNNIWRGVTIDEDAVQCKLKKGTNSLLVKVNNGGGDFGFCLKLLQKENNKDISVILPNKFYADEIYAATYSSFNIFSTYNGTGSEPAFTVNLVSEVSLPKNFTRTLKFGISLCNPKGTELETIHSGEYKDFQNFKSKEITFKPKQLSPGRYTIKLKVSDETDKLLSVKENIVFWK